MKHIVILGNGIAGITAARHIRKKSNDRITVISGETDHFFSRTALMYIYMGHMKYEHTKPYEDWFWDKNKIELCRAWVTHVDFDQKKINLENGSSLSYDQLLLATGSQSNKFGWPGQDLQGVQGLYSFQDLELMEKNTQSVKRAVIIGGGLIGVEMAEMLRTRNIEVTYLIREDHFWGNVLPAEEGSLIDRHLAAHKIDLRSATELEEILDDGQGRVRGVRTKNGEEIPCEFVGLTVGVSPNIEMFKNTPLETDRGILVDAYLQTNFPDVYAAGDCVQLKNPTAGRRPIEAVWYVGRMMGETVAQTLSGTPTKYAPGPWFNSAKFFDIEYQTYGLVLPSCPDDCGQFYWESEDALHGLKIIFQKSDLTVKGINVFGMRHRHEVWDRWLKENITLPKVMQQLPKANFDPEFFKRWEKEIQEAYNLQFPDHRINPVKRSIMDKILNR